MVSSVEVTHAELDEFIAIYRAACEEALSPSPRLEKGAHCRFCPARPICPAHTGPLLDLASSWCRRAAAAPSKEAYLQLLADGLNLVDAVKDIGKALHDQAKQALHAGDAVPGYTLSAGRAVRQWRDDEPTAIAALIASRPRSATTSSPRRCARPIKSSFAPRRAASRFPRNSSFRIPPASRWCGSKTHAPRCPAGTNSCGHSPRLFKPSKGGANHDLSLSDHDHDPDHDPDRDQRPLGTRLLLRRRRRRARRPDGVGHGAQRRRHRGRRRPLGHADAAVQGPRGQRHLDVRAEEDHPRGR